MDGTGVNNNINFMKNTDLFLGHDIPFWLELKKKAAQLNVVDLIKEIADLRSKVSFYESRIEQLNIFKETVDK